MNDVRESNAKPTAHAALRWFDLALRALMLFLAIGIVIALPLIATGATVGLDVKLEPPYSVEYGDRTIEVAGDGGNTTFVDAPDDVGTYPQQLEVTGEILVDRDDTDTRVVQSVVMGVVFGLGAVVLFKLWRLVRSARDGEPFDGRNVQRLRWIAGAVFLAAVTTRVGTAVLERTIDSTPDVSVTMQGLGVGGALMIALAFLALAEVFRTGTELRELEQATI